MSSRYYNSHTSSYDRDRVTYAVQRIIVFTSLVFAVQLVLEILLGPTNPPGGRVSSWLAFHSRGPVYAYLWQPITYQFVHGGLSHLFFNMLMLFFFGPEVERALGTRQFFRFYVICGAVGVLASLLKSETVVGASGAVMAVLVAHAVINPEREFFFFPFPVPINVRAVVMIVIVLNLVNALLGSGSSWLTHLGGMGVGYAYMKAAPVIRKWRFRMPRRKAAPKSAPEGDGSRDPIAEAVDNIFKFEDKKRRGK
ncbi:MAG: rhomboid family intramembrane serine protease [FCB group bacterium]|jgi:membrane associated rhomboid family serine protease|nr:rhomboid family intramembrane serine protease [FCB group bacterium]